MLDAEQSALPIILMVSRSPTLESQALYPNVCIRVAHKTIPLVQTQGRNILTYSKYLLERARVFSQTRVDHVGRGTGRLKQLSIDKGLLMETEGVQREVDAILKCDVSLTMASVYG